MMHNTREEWLTAGITALWPYLHEAGIGADDAPKVRVSVGFPKGSRGGKGSHAIGQCWHASASADETREIFISPELADPLRVLDVLLHELIHAALPADEGHGKGFGRVARAVGLEGKLTATTRGRELDATLQSLYRELGEYPHAQLTAARGSLGGPKKQGTRMLKIECDTCGMVARTTAKWIDNPGLPTCACGGSFETGD